MQPQVIDTEFEARWNEAYQTGLRWIHSPYDIAQKLIGFTMVPLEGRPEFNLFYRGKDIILTVREISEDQTTPDKVHSLRMVRRGGAWWPVEHLVAQQDR
ncbi:MAG: hypothetical protein ACK4UN_06615 [Limisphaerales bacterium]